MTHSILDRAADARLGVNGIPYMVIENALPVEYYAELAATFPSPELIAGAGPLPSNAVFRYPTAAAAGDSRLTRTWRDFMEFHCSRAFFEQIVRVFGEAVDRMHPGLRRNFGKPLSAFSVGMREPGGETVRANREHDIVLDCQISVNSAVQTPGTVRGPHLDRQFKLFAALLYFRDPDDKSDGGDLRFYKLKSGRGIRPRPAKIDADNVESIDHIPYRANTLVTFVNSPLCIHGVTARSVTAFPRRYVNFLGECYGGRDRDGFFTVPDPWPNRMALRAERQWRRLTARRPAPTM
jgi:hypothetical protein